MHFSHVRKNHIFPPEAACRPIPTPLPPYSGPPDPKNAGLGAGRRHLLLSIMQVCYVFHSFARASGCNVFRQQGTHSARNPHWRSHVFIIFWPDLLPGFWPDRLGPENALHSYAGTEKHSLLHFTVRKQQIQNSSLGTLEYSLTNTSTSSI